jgi:hypothetical protein
MSDETPNPSEATPPDKVIPFAAPAAADEPKPKRRGKAEKSKKGEPAAFIPGAAKGPREFDPEKIAGQLHLWWEDGDGQTFIVGSHPKVMPANGVSDALFEENPQIWSRWPEKKIVNLLRTKFVRLKPREGETLCEVDRLLLHVMQQRRLDLAITALAGYPAGIYDVGGQRVLVRTGPRLVEPREGEWPTVNELLRAKLDFSYGDDEGHGVDQLPYFHGWMKTALEALYLGGPGNFRPGQACIFIGPRNCGKSRIQHQIITGLLGGEGRSADPGPYLFGRTDFNGEMFSAEHLMMEDPASSTKTVDRVFFGEMLKQLVVNDTQRLHRKREDAIVVSPFFRTTISVNDDPDKMRVLPLLTPDMKDKVHLFYVSKHPLPMPTGTLPQRADFRRKIAEELPAYAWWLLSKFEIPEDLRSERFGVREWHHPTLAMELFDDTPAAELLQIIDAATFKASGADGGLGNRLWDLKSHAKEDEDRWEGSALELERLLLGEGEWKCSLDREAKKLCMHNKIDRLLSRLKEDQPGRIIQHRTRLERRWIVVAPE